MMGAAPSLYRQTFVAEYQRMEDAPGVRANMDCMGGRLVSVLFGDGLAEGSRVRDALQRLVDNEMDHDECDDDDCLWCDARRALQAHE